MTRRPLIERLRQMPPAAAIDSPATPSQIDDDQLAAYLDDQLSAAEIAAFEASALHDRDAIREVYALDQPTEISLHDENKALASMRRTVASSRQAQAAAGTPSSSIRLAAVRSNVFHWKTASAIASVAVVALLAIAIWLAPTIRRDEAVVLDPSTDEPREPNQSPSPKLSPESIGPDSRPLSPLLVESATPHPRPTAVPMPRNSLGPTFVSPLPNALVSNPDTPAPAVVQTIRGLAFVRDQTGWVPLKETDEIPMGDVAVPAGGWLELALGNKTRLVINGGSKLRLVRCEAIDTDVAARVDIRVELSEDAKVAGLAVPPGSSLSIRSTVDGTRESREVELSTNTMADVIASATSDTLSATVLAGTAAAGQIVVSEHQTLTASGEVRIANIAKDWLRKPSTKWALSDRTTQQLASSSNVGDALLAVTNGPDAIACTTLAIELSQQGTVFAALADGGSHAQHEALREWLIAASPAAIRSKNTWAELGRSQTPTEAWFRTWRTWRRTGQAPTVQRDGLAVLLAGLDPSEPRFVRESAIAMMRELTRNPIANYDPAAPTTRGRSEASQALDNYWRRVQQRRARSQR